MSSDPHKGEDRRLAPRFRIQVPVWFANGTVSGTGVTRDISLTGVRIDEVSVQPDPHAALELRFSFFVGSFETPFRARWIRPTNKGGFAVQFTELGGPQLDLLRRALPV